MNIRKNNDTSLFIESKYNTMFLARNGVDCYFLEITPDENKERKFIMSHRGFVEFEEEMVFETFEDFIAAMFGNNVLHGEYKSSKINFDFENKTITIMSDSNNHASLKITYKKDTIEFEVSKESKEDLANSVIYFYSDCNLRGGYIKIFRELFEKLNEIALDQEKPLGRTRRVSDNNFPKKS